MPASDRLCRVASHLLASACAEGEAVDLVIRKAQVVDGTGKPRFAGDVAVRDGKICFVGSQFTGQAKKEVDAGGKILSPGFIDIHTHFDPYLCWDGRCDPSPKHGVTTIVIGNCSLGVAPCKNPHDANRIIGMFGCIEDIKKQSFYAGVPFDKWETFPQYLDYIRPNLTVNVGALMGHSLVRLFVMGEDSQKRAATPQEVDQMVAMVEEGMAAGALGFSSSLVDIDENNVPVPSRWADMEEKKALASAVGRAGRKWAGGKFRGVWELVPSLNGFEGDKASIQELGEISRAGGIHGTFQPLMTTPRDPLRKRLTEVMEEEARKGGLVYGQTTPRDFNMGLRLAETSIMAMGLSGWSRNMKIEDPEERVRAFADPKQRPRMVEAMKKKPGSAPKMKVTKVVHPDNQKYIGKEVRQIAQEEGKELADVILDIAVKDKLETEFWIADAINMDKKAIAQQLEHPQLQLGASDAGAHITQFCGSGDTTALLERFVKKDNLLSLEFAVHTMTGRLAEQMGMHDRGTIAVGKAADLTLFDMDKLTNGPDVFVQDMPGKQNRYTRFATGYAGVWVNGEKVLENDEYTSVTGCGKVV